jgi:hypothetical protein
MFVIPLPVVEFEANGCALNWYRRCGAAAHRKNGEEQGEIYLVAYHLQIVSLSFENLEAC